MIGDSRFF